MVHITNIAFVFQKSQISIPIVKKNVDWSIYNQFRKFSKIDILNLTKNEIFARQKLLQNILLTAWPVANFRNQNQDCLLTFLSTLEGNFAENLESVETGLQKIGSSQSYKN